MKTLLIASLIVGLTSLGSIATAADHAAKAAEKAEKKEHKPVPFHGNIDSVDKNAKTIKVGERTFHVTPKTKLSKDGKPATFDDAKSGEEVGGTYHEGLNGKLELGLLRIGPKPEAEGKSKHKNK